MMRIKLLPLLATAAFLAIVGPPPGGASASLDPSIVLSIETPTDGVNTGVGLVRGFALSPGGIDYVEWTLDGDDMGPLPYGGARGDVSAIHPGFPDSPAPGYATAWNWGLLDPGEHTIVVTAHGLDGGEKSVLRAFETTRFGPETFLSADEISLDSFKIQGLSTTGGSFHDVTLKWSKADQQFMIHAIETTCSPCAGILVSAPSNLMVTSSGGLADLSWTAPLLPSSSFPAPLGYLVERRFDGAPFETVGLVAIGKTEFTDDVDVSTEADPGTFDWRVRAVFASMVTAPSNVDSITIAP